MIENLPNNADSTFNTPLPPSVEKAYYRKCIELKRRLNEVEAANDEAKIRRVRLDRGILKMRLERAFLLDELRKRMEHNVDGSEGSADEGMATVWRCTGVTYQTSYTDSAHSHRQTDHTATSADARSPQHQPLQRQEAAHTRTNPQHTPAASRPCRGYHHNQKLLRRHQAAYRYLRMLENTTSATHTHHNPNKSHHRQPTTTAMRPSPSPQAPMPHAQVKSTAATTLT